MDDLKERLHQIACCEGECRANRIEAWYRIAKLEAQLDDADECELKALARAGEAEAKLDAVRKWEQRQRELIGVHVQTKKVDKAVDDVIQTFCDELLAALNGEDDG